jgi:hydrogenase maturation protein HypF
VCDAHPDYLSTAYARRLGTETRQVQHHLAHVVSAMAENEIEPPALGVSWDGTGFGLDGTIWGGEFIAVTPGSARRVASFRAFPLPGGDRAVREPRRTALALLCEVFGEAAWEMEDVPTIAAFSQAERRILRAMIERGVNAPRTSSVGRLFDAAASIAGLRHHVRFEGQAAMALEFAREGTETDEAYPLAFVDAGRPERGDQATVAGLIDAPLWTIDPAPLARALVADARAGVPVGIISARFHNGLVEAAAEIAHRTALERVVLSGGCFQNRYLLERMIARLRAEGFRPVWHQRFPPNDGGIALGQVAAVSWHLA